MLSTEITHLSWAIILDLKQSRSYWALDNRQWNNPNTKSYQCEASWVSCFIQVNAEAIAFTRAWTLFCIFWSKWDITRIKDVKIDLLNTSLELFFRDCKFQECNLFSTRKSVSSEIFWKDSAERSQENQLC